MLQENKPSPKLQQWYDKLAPIVENAQKTLRESDPHKLMLRSGCAQDAKGGFRLNFLWQELAIADDFVVRRTDTGEAVPSFIQSMVLTYMVTADGTTPSGRWIGFRELPNGMFYTRAFQGYSGDRLIRELIGGIDAFRLAAAHLNGTPLDLGDAGYTFAVLPRVHIGLAYWEGDQDFPAQCRVLFEDTAAHYMPTDGLAILGSLVVGKFLKAAQ
jgi:hypothetical protein